MSQYIIPKICIINYYICFFVFISLCIINTWCIWQKNIDFFQVICFLTLVSDSQWEIGKPGLIFSFVRCFNLWATSQISPASYRLNCWADWVLPPWLETSWGEGDFWILKPYVTIAKHILHSTNERIVEIIKTVLPRRKLTLFILCGVIYFIQILRSFKKYIILSMEVLLFATFWRVP